MFVDIIEPDMEAHERMQQRGYSVHMVSIGPDGEQRVWQYARRGPGRPFVTMRAPLTLVFDMNGVLGCKFYDPQHHLAHRVHVVEGSIAFLRRPGARRLIRVCCEAGHKVVLWTSMKRRAARACAEILIPHKDRERVLVLSNEDAPRDDTQPEDSSAILKDLNVVWSRCPSSNPSRTLIIDDDPRKTRLQPGHRVDPPSIFAPSSPEDPCIFTDRGMELLLEVLEAQAESEDVIAGV